MSQSSRKTHFSWYSHRKFCWVNCHWAETCFVFPRISTFISVLESWTLSVSRFCQHFHWVFESVFCIIIHVSYISLNSDYSPNWTTFYDPVHFCSDCLNLCFLSRFLRKQRPHLVGVHGCGRNHPVRWAYVGTQDDSSPRVPKILHFFREILWQSWSGMTTDEENYMRGTQKVFMIMLPDPKNLEWSLESSDKTNKQTKRPTQ